MSLPFDSLRKLENIMKCSICKSTFDYNNHKPMILKCGHTFCKQCIYTEKTFFICPTDNLKHQFIFDINNRDITTYQNLILENILKEILTIKEPKIKEKNLIYSKPEIKVNKSPDKICKKFTKNKNSNKNINIKINSGNQIINVNAINVNIDTRNKILDNKMDTFNDNMNIFQHNEELNEEKVNFSSDKINDESIETIPLNDEKSMTNMSFRDEFKELLNKNIDLKYSIKTDDNKINSNDKFIKENNNMKTYNKKNYVYDNMIKSTENNIKINKQDRISAYMNKQKNENIFCKNNNYNAINSLTQNKNDIGQRDKIYKINKNEIKDIFRNTNYYELSQNNMISKKSNNSVSKNSKIINKQISILSLQKLKNDSNEHNYNISESKRNYIYKNDDSLHGQKMEKMYKKNKTVFRKKKKNIYDDKLDDENKNKINKNNESFKSGKVNKYLYSPAYKKNIVGSKNIYLSNKNSLNNSSSKIIYSSNKNIFDNDNKFKTLNDQSKNNNIIKHTKDSSKDLNLFNNNDIIKDEQNNPNIISIYIKMNNKTNNKYQSNIKSKQEKDNVIRLINSKNFDSKDYRNSFRKHIDDNFSIRLDEKWKNFLEKENINFEGGYKKLYEKFKKSKFLLNISEKEKELLNISMVPGTNDIFIGFLDNNDILPFNPKKGVLLSENGDYYEGGFANGKKEGNGMIIYKNGTIYEGNFKQNKYHNQGKLTQIDGEIFIGEWKEGKIWGRGVRYHNNGDKYTGYYVNNTRNGQGHYEFACGDYYDGNWENGKANGQGKFVFKNGNIYEGKFKDNKITGSGKFVMENGDIYIGVFDNGIINGKGTLTQKNGEKYVGYFKNGKKDGEGSIYDKEGNIIKSGIWVQNEYVDSL